MSRKHSPTQPAPLRLPASATGDRIDDPARIEVLGDAGRCVVVAVGRPVWGPSDFAPARHVALRKVLCAAVGRARVAAVFRAAAAAIDARGVLLIGNSGAGKTTLLAELLLAGAHYLADDLVALDREGDKVWPFPVAVSLKPGSRRALAQRLAARPGFALPPADAYGLSYLGVPQSVTASSPAAVRLLCFPRFDQRVPDLAVQALPPATALATALNSGARITGLPKRAEPLARLLATVPAVTLTYADAHAAVRYIRATLRGRHACEAAKASGHARCGPVAAASHPLQHHPDLFLS